jgi:hypothetical protein
MHDEQEVSLEEPFSTVFFFYAFQEIASLGSPEELQPQELSMNY